jgi:hypothetical protein
MHEHAEALFHDFRRFYGVSAASIGSQSLGWDEAFYLMMGLLRNTASLFYCETFYMDKPMSTESLLLTAVHNRIVDSIPVEKKDRQAKQKAKIDPPQQNKPKTQLNAEQASKRMAFSKIATE